MSKSIGVAERQLGCPSSSLPVLTSTATPREDESERDEGDIEDEGAAADAVDASGDAVGTPVPQESWTELDLIVPSHIIGLDGLSASVLGGICG